MSTSLSVLLLEDDPSSIRLFNRKVQTAPVEIVVKDVRNREGFLRELESPNFDCVIIDYTLPDINGLEALKLVKEMAPGTPTIIYTGSVGEEKAVECMKEGAAEFLLKTNSVRLVPAILSVVNQKRDHEARIQAEEAQRQSEERFHALAETSTAAIVIFQDNKITFINSVAEEITGYTHKELMEINFLDLVHPDYKELVQQRGAARQRGENVPARYEFKIITKDGQERWLDFALGAIQHASGSAVLGIGLDATARKDAENQLKASEQRYRTLFEANPNPMWLFDIETQEFIAVNDAAVSHYGFSRDEFLSMKIIDIVPSGDTNVIEEHLKNDKEANGLHKCIMCKHVKKNGEVIEVEAISHTLEFAGHKARMVLAMDVTDRRRTEEALRSSESNYRSLFESARDIIFTLSLDGNITAINPAFELYTGWKREEWIGRHIFEIIHPDEKPRANEALQRVSSGGPSFYNEYSIRKKTGDYLIGEIRITLQIRNGEKVGLLGIARDVTTQRKLEQQFRQVQKMESIGTLAGGVAHDFNNIMGIVYAYLTLAEQHINDTNKIKQDIEMIRTASDRAAALVRQLLTFARKSSVIFELVDVHNLINELVPMLQATFPKTIEIVQDMEETIPFINADKNQLHQALLNIAVNARDAMPSGGSLRFKSDVVTSEKLKIKIPDVPAGNYVHIAVTDNGCGMDEHTRTKAFDPFFTSKEKGKGTGLGLAVVYGIAGSHDGFVDIESEVNKGTTVHIYIPASSKKPPENQPANDLNDIKGGNETILVVEDELPLRFYLKILFEGKGYNVLEASNGVEGIKIFDENKNQIKLIVSDFGMPKLDGLGLLQKVKEIQPTVKLIMTSGYITPDQKVEILHAGAADVISKPYKPHEILQRIREVIDSVV